MSAKQDALRRTLTTAPVIPVIVLEDWHAAVPMGRALVKGGLPVLEVTLRTPAAMDVIRALIGEVEGAIVGAGTVMTPAQMEAVDKAGCAFAVAPGAAPGILAASDGVGCPLLPGAATASEVMALLERGQVWQKFFPAEPAGGRAYLKALASPIPQVTFCPTGGITPATAPEYLKLPNVVCVGGSWLTPPDLLAAKDWNRIEALARAASELGDTK